MNDYDKSYGERWEDIKRYILKSETKYAKSRRVAAKNTRKNRRKEKARRKASKR